MKLGIAPIGWANDDLRDWGAERTGPEIMAEVARAGYAGSEMSYTYPSDPEVLKAALAEHGLELCGAYRWTNLANSERHAIELERAQEHVAFCRAAGARYAILAEGAGSLHWDARGQSSVVTPLDQAGWRRVTEGLRRVAEFAASQGVRLCYHAHAGTAIERRPEIDRLFELLEPEELSFCLDTAQLAYAGEDPEQAARDYAARIPYAHLKDVRPAVLDQVHLRRPRFLEAVQRNVFCTPGAGGLDWSAILPHLRQADWWVVEADQDPAQAPPFQVAEAARRFLEAFA
ncbi:MAG: inosose dehydratase [Candidatus Xenobia bacterium]